MNFVYAGIENPIMVTIGSKIKQPRITVDNGVIRHIHESTYSVTPDSVGICRIIIKDSSKFIFAPVLRVKAIPAPEPYILDSIGSGLLSTELLNQISSLKLIFRDFPWDIAINVKEFRISLVSPSKTIELLNSGGVLNKQSIQVIRQAKSGDFLIIDSIVYQLFENMKKLDKSVVLRVQ